MRFLEVSYYIKVLIDFCQSSASDSVAVMRFWGGFDSASGISIIFGGVQSPERLS
jgi:hypothetical protein